MEGGAYTRLDPFFRKLQQAGELSPEDKAELAHLIGASIHDVPSHHDLIREGEKPNKVRLILAGMACRYKVLPDGNRQIMAFLLPGDFCDLHVSILGQMDHAIATVTDCTVALVSSEALDAVAAGNHRIARVLWWSTLVDEAVLREWLVNLGQRSGDKRMAHLLCELFVRLKAAGRIHASAFDLPLTQQELGKALGLSSVHVNRVLKELRVDGLIQLNGRRVTIPDVEALMKRAQFNPNYLHLREEAAAIHHLA